MTAIGLLTLMIPFQAYTTEQDVADGSSTNETGMGAQFEWFAAPEVSFGGAYAANVNLSTRSLVFSGFDVGAQHYLAGGATETYGTEGVSFSSAPRLHVFYGLFLARREFDFSAFDKTRDAPILEGPRPVTSGSFLGPLARFGLEWGFGRSLRAGVRGSYIEGLASSEGIRVRVFEGALSLGVAL